MCQIDVIRKCNKVKQVKEALKTLPKTLDETYERILSNIPDKDVEDVRRVLQCLVCAFHPLDFREVADIVAIDTVWPYYDPENGYPRPRELLSVCSGLVSTRIAKRRLGNERENKQFEIEELRLAHFSVKEYLVSDRVNLGSASKYKLDEVTCHGILADLCISYLLHFEGGVYDRQTGTKILDAEAQESRDEQLETQSGGLFEDDHLCEQNPFAPYAAMSWSMHLRAARLNDTTPLYPKSMKLIADPALLDPIVKHHRYWFGDSYIVRRTLSNFDKGRDGGKNYPKTSISPVYHASLLGLDHHVSQLLKEGGSASSMGPGGSAVAAAASFGHESTVELLVKMGADVNAQRIEGNGTFLSMTALQAAIERKYENIIDFLLDHGAAVNTKRIVDGFTESTHVIYFNTPLQAAAIFGRNTSLVRKLLDRGADVTVEGGRIGDALYIACNQKQGLYLVPLLLEKGADPNAPQMHGQTALEGAILKENKPIQQLLIEYGADVALVNFDNIRRNLPHYSKHLRGKDVIENYIAQTKARLAYFESLPKRSIATSDSNE